jgi:hypothetical protein
MTQISCRGESLQSVAAGAFEDVASNEAAAASNQDVATVHERSLVTEAAANAYPSEIWAGAERAVFVAGRLPPDDENRDNERCVPRNGCLGENAVDHGEHPVARPRRATTRPSTLANLSGIVENDPGGPAAWSGGGP